jgi:tetratricopeptide (TPR) repeat protein
MRLFGLFLVFLLCVANTHLMAQPGFQNLPLAMQFYQQAEYEKAAALLEDVLKSDPNNVSAYQYLYACHVQLRQFEKAEKLAAGMAKRDAGQASYEVDRAYAMRQQGEEKKSVQLYESLLKKLGPNRGQIIMLTNAFRNRGENDYGIKCLQRGRQLLAEPFAFALELADLYQLTGQKALMVSAYLDYLALAPQQLGYVQNMLQSRLAEEDYELLRGVLLSGMQQRPDDLMLSELLVWFFVQQLDFETAFVQAKALDQRLNEQGRRMLALARSANENKQYKSAALFYDYLIALGERHPMYFEARYESLETRRLELGSRGAARAEWMQLATELSDFLRDFPQHRQVLLVKKTYARVLAYELQRFEEAVDLLELAVEGGGERRLLAAVKLDLGDLYLLTQANWEAALVYGQVEKDFPNDPLGQEAKFRNARLSYFKGEFEWSQAQLDVLKGSTTQKIANDALSLSLLISDNLDLDTTILPMQAFAAVELLLFRQEYTAAIAGMEQLLADFPNHGLGDEVYLRLAQAHQRLGQPAKAAEWYQKLIDTFGTDILGDDALFALAVLTEEQLRQTAEAAKLYERLLQQYPDSTFTFEARRRFRKMRGDNLN